MSITADRDEGQAVALAAATTGHSYLPHVEVLLSVCIASGVPFTTDDVRDALDSRGRDWLTAHGNVLGALTTQAARAGRITQVGWTTSRRTERRGAPLRIWKGNHQ